MQYKYEAYLGDMPRPIGGGEIERKAVSLPKLGRFGGER